MTNIERCWISLNRRGHASGVYENAAEAARDKAAHDYEVVEYVRADLHRGAVEALERIADDDVPHPAEGYDVYVPESIREFARDALHQLRGR